MDNKTTVTLASLLLLGALILGALWLATHGAPAALLAIVGAMPATLRAIAELVRCLG